MLWWLKSNSCPPLHLHLHKRTMSKAIRYTGLPFHNYSTKQIRYWVFDLFTNFKQFFFHHPLSYLEGWKIKFLHYLLISSQLFLGLVDQFLSRWTAVRWVLSPGNTATSCRGAVVQSVGKVQSYGRGFEFRPWHKVVGKKETILPCHPGITLKIKWADWENIAKTLLSHCMYRWSSLKDWIKDTRTLPCY